LSAMTLGVVNLHTTFSYKNSASWRAWLSAGQSGVASEQEVTIWDWFQHCFYVLLNESSLPVGSLLKPKYNNSYI